MIPIDYSDQRLIASALKGEEISYKLLFERHYHFVRSIAAKFVSNQHDQEELIQDIFCKAFRKLSTFENSSKLTTWLHPIAKNLCINFVVNRSRKQNLRKEFDRTLLPDFKQKSSPKAYQNIDRAFVRKMMDSLSPEDNNILTLYYIDDKSVDMITDLTGNSKSNVKVRLHRARKRLKKKVEMYLHYEQRYLPMAG